MSPGHDKQMPKKFLFLSWVKSETHLASAVHVPGTLHGQHDENSQCHKETWILLQTPLVICVTIPQAEKQIITSINI